jgi:Family of unknown function (DUF6640)
VLRQNIGRLLISIAAVVTAVAPLRADWSDSHVFSGQWSPHARFQQVQRAADDEHGDGPDGQQVRHAPSVSARYAAAAGRASAMGMRRRSERG